MSRFKYAFALMLLMIFAGCSRPSQERSEQQQHPEVTQPSAAETATSQNAPEEANPAVAPVSSTADSSATEPAPSTKARSSKKATSSVPSKTKSAPSRDEMATSAESNIPPSREALAPAVESKTPPAAPKPPEPIYAAIPSGTSILVRLKTPLDSSVNKSGDTFEAVLDKDIEADGNIVAARGCLVEGKLSHVERSGRVEGRAAMSLQLISMIVGDRKYPLHTQVLALQAESTKKQDATKVGIGAGLGAVIGAIAGGGKGAAIGAAVGAGAGGATVVATRGKEVKLDVEQSLNFELREGINVQLK